MKNRSFDPIGPLNILSNFEQRDFSRRQSPWRWCSCYYGGVSETKAHFARLHEFVGFSMIVLWLCHLPLAFWNRHFDVAVRAKAFFAKKAIFLDWLCIVVLYSSRWSRADSRIRCIRCHMSMSVTAKVQAKAKAKGKSDPKARTWHMWHCKALQSVTGIWTHVRDCHCLTDPDATLTWFFDIFANALRIFRMFPDRLIAIDLRKARSAKGSKAAKAKGRGRGSTAGRRGRKWACQELVQMQSHCNAVHTSGCHRNSQCRYVYVSGHPWLSKVSTVMGGGMIMLEVAWFEYVTKASFFQLGGLESPIAWNFIINSPTPPADWFTSSLAVAQSPRRRRRHVASKIRSIRILSIIGVVNDHKRMLQVTGAASLTIGTFMASPKM